jgi:glycosyltransferase involved in cell wall biosynthesis
LATAQNGESISRMASISHAYPRHEEQAALRTRLGLHPNATTIGLVARYHPMKDVETFLRAASFFRKSRVDAQFILCGDGFSFDNGILKGMITNLELDGHIVLLGRRPDMEVIYPTLDILTLCSIYGEGFPNVLCEAMVCGVSCVASDTGDSAEIIGDCGVIVPMRNPEAAGARVANAS